MREPVVAFPLLAARQDVVASGAVLFAVAPTAVAVVAFATAVFAVALDVELAAVTVVEDAGCLLDYSGATE